RQVTGARATMASVTTLPPLEPLAAVRVDAIEVGALRLPLARPFRTAGGVQRDRLVLLVHVLAAEAEGWAECAVEPVPTYSPEFSDAARLVLLDHLLPLALAGPTGDALAL